MTHFGSLTNKKCENSHIRRKRVKAKSESENEGDATRRTVNV